MFIPKKMHLIPHSNGNITSYKTVLIATGVLSRKRLPHILIASLIMYYSNVFGIIQILVTMVTMGIYVRF